MFQFYQAIELITRSIIYSSIIIKVFIFDDIKDEADILRLNASYIETIDTKYITWNRESYNATSTEVEVTVNGTNEKLMGHEGVINLKVHKSNTCWRFFFLKAKLICCLLISTVKLFR